MPKPPWLENYNKRYLFPELLEPDDVPLNSAKVKVVVGQFFEALGVQIFGAKYGEVNGCWKIYPDAWIKRAFKGRDVLLEIKGGGRSYGFLIDLGQVREYGDLQAGGSPFTKEYLDIPFLSKSDIKPPFNNPMVYYVLFIHGLSSIKKTCETVPQLIKELSKNVIGAVVLPQSVVATMVERHLTWREYMGRDKGSRGGKGHEHFVRLSAYKASKWANGTADITEFLGEIIAGDDNPPWKVEDFAVDNFYIGSRKLLTHAVNNFMMGVVREKGLWTPKPKGARRVKFLEG